MHKLLNPYWVMAVNTIPGMIILYIFAGKYQIVKSLLSEENVMLWKRFGLALLLLALANFAYALYLVWRKKILSPIYAVTVLIVYILYLYAYGYYINQFVPMGVPLWMLPGDIVLYVGAFVIPALLHALVILVVCVTPDEPKKGAWRDFSVIILVPLAWYILTQVIFPLWKTVSSEYGMHVLVIVTIAATVVFLFFVMRGAYRLVINRSSLMVRYQLAWKIPFTLVLPLIGLSLNNGDFRDLFAGDGAGIFGDFSHPWYYILAIINGLLLCIPAAGNRRARLFLFVARSITFSFTFYFFMVFLPLLPLSVIAITLAGGGFLMLTPLVLFVIHTGTLTRDNRFLAQYHAPGKRLLLFSAGLLVIPVLLAGNYLHHRSVLNEALAYLYEPDYAGTNPEIDIDSLAVTLETIRRNKNRTPGFVFGYQTPYLSAFYNWLVLDNLTLSEQKISLIEKVFYGEAKETPFRRSEQFDDVRISSINTGSRYDEEQGVWVSQIDMALVNKNSEPRLAEYRTVFTLPAGCWISDYYLYVGDRKEKGLLAEKRAAKWIYSEIRNTRRDPGILYYQSGNRVAFRVFPFNKSETRRTGIELIHRDAVSLKIDGKTIILGKKDRPVKDVKRDEVIYVSAHNKKQLQKKYRTPYLHFIVDASKVSKASQQRYIRRIESVLKKVRQEGVQHRISFAGSYTRTTTMDNNWKTLISRQPYQGGFYLERAINKILYDAYVNQKNSYPLIVVISDDIDRAIIDKDFANLKFAYPEQHYYYVVESDRTMAAYSLFSSPLLKRKNQAGSFLQQHAVRVYMDKSSQVTYLPDNDQPDIILRKPLHEIPDKWRHEKNWLTGLYMQAAWRSRMLYPSAAGSKWQNLVNASFQSGVMSPLTSYLVLENEAQKAALLDRQKQLLSGGQHLDAGEDVLRMSEPGLFVLLVLLASLLAIRRKVVTAC